MRPLSHKLLLLSLLGFVMSNARGQTYEWQTLTTDDAVQQVRSFEGNPNMAVTVTAMPPTNSGGPSLSYYYQLTAGNYIYIVDEYTSDAFVRIDNSWQDITPTSKSQFYGQPYDLGTLASQAITQDAAQSIAEAFMQTHYPEPQLLNGVTIKPNEATPNADTDPTFIESYEVRFYEDLGNGVVGPADCTVVIDTVRQQIVGYYSNHYPVLASITPGLTGDEAMATAMNALQILNGTPGMVDGLVVSVPDAMGAENLSYWVDFYGNPPNSSSYEHYIVNVDANTGNVIHSTTTSEIPSIRKKASSPEFIGLRLQLAKRHNVHYKSLRFIWLDKEANLVYPPLLISNRPYMYANYLCYGTPFIKLSTTKDKQFILAMPTHQLKFAVDSPTYHLNNQAHKMPAKSVLVNGQCYVPLEMLQAVLPGKFTYNAKAQTVRFDPPKPKQAQK